jgi:hypothetical protein
MESTNSKKKILCGRDGKNYLHTDIIMLYLQPNKLALTLNNSGPIQQ